MTDIKKIVMALVGVALLVIVGAVAYSLGASRGKNLGKKEMSTNLEPLVNMAFPKPADEIHSLSGIIKNMYGATIDLEVESIDDYLPHPDGSPRAKEMRFASLTSKTSITSLDYRTLDVQGNPLITILPTSNLKPGLVVTVTSDQNVRTAKKFDVKTVEIVNY